MLPWPFALASFRSTKIAASRKRELSVLSYGVPRMTLEFSRRPGLAIDVPICRLQGDSLARRARLAIKDRMRSSCAACFFSHASLAAPLWWDDADVGGSASGVGDFPDNEALDAQRGGVSERVVAPKRPWLIECEGNEIRSKKRSIDG